MINHVVLFKLKDYPESEKVKIISELKKMIKSLKQKIKEVKYLEVGVNHELQAKSFDIALISHFENPEHLNRYRIHPEHLKVVERINETTIERAAVDYIF
jgi:hypothetical protein